MGSVQKGVTPGVVGNSGDTPCPYPLGNHPLKGNANMRKLIRNALVAGAVAAATVGLTGTPALADHGNWDVEPEGPVTAASYNTVLKNKVGNTTYVLTCDEALVDDAEVFDDLHGGTLPELNYVADIFSTTWNDCVGPLNINFEVTHDDTWKLYALSEDNNHIVSGELRNVTAHISDGFLCDATIEGTVHGTYDNNGTLTINEPLGGDLVVTSASCLGILNTGDRPSFEGDFEIDPVIQVHNH